MSVPKAVLFLCAAALCSSAQKLSLEPAQLQAPPKVPGDATPQLVVKAEGLTDAQLAIKATPVLKESDDKVPGSLTYTFDKELDPAKGVRRWSFKVGVKELPEGAPSKRAVDFTYGEIKAQKLEFTLVTPKAATAAAAWTITPPADPWVMTGFRPERHCTSLIIAAGETGAERAQLAGSTLVEQSTKKPLSLDHLSLCADKTEAHCGEQTVPPLHPTPYYLCVDDQFHAMGNFKGNIYLSADKKQEVTLVPLNVYSSSFWAKLFGVLLIVVGVAASWFVLTFAKARIARDQDLVPALILRQRADALLKRVAALQRYAQQTESMRNELVALQNQLSEANLELNNFIHPVDPSPFAAVTVDGPGYKTFLANTTSALDTLTVIVGGMESAAGRTANDEPKRQLIAAAIGDLDKLRPAVSTPAQAVTQVNQILTKLDADLAGTQAPPKAGLVRAPAAAAPMTLDRLRFELKTLNWWVWGIAMLLTSVAGAAVLILPNAGFGVPMDFVYCLLWGFGLPIAGQQLAPGSVKSALFG